MKLMKLMKLNRGFTLIEVLVAATIFAIAVTSMSALFVSSLRGQRSIFAQQLLADNTRFLIEQMSRQIRMAQKDSSGSCTGTPGTIYSAGGPTLQFVDSSALGNCVTYDLFSGKIRIRPSAAASFLDVTSDDIQVNVLYFSVQGGGVADNEQPRVTISIEAEVGGPAAANLPEIVLQTTVSARELDVP